MCLYHGLAVHLVKWFHIYFKKCLPARHKTDYRCILHRAAQPFLGDVFWNMPRSTWWTYQSCLEWSWLTKLCSSADMPGKSSRMDLHVEMFLLVLFLKKIKNHTVDILKIISHINAFFWHFNRDILSPAALLGSPVRLLVHAKIQLGDHMAAIQCL